MNPFFRLSMLLGFAVVVPMAAQAADIPFFSSYPKTDAKRWYISNGWVNGKHQSCEWRSDAVSGRDNNLLITLSGNGGKVRPLGCGEMQTTKLTGYGTYEARIRTAAGSGLNTAFFTYSGPPVGQTHDEIDFEFLGKDSHTVQLNYFTNGKGNHEHIVQLGFDASAEFHDYTIVWEPFAIHWYVDGKLVHEVKNVAPLPSHPGHLYVSLWSGTKQTDAWLGPFTYNEPKEAEFAWVKYTPRP